MFLDDAPGEPDGAPSVWVWVAVDAMGGGGILAAHRPGLGTIAMVTTRKEQATGVMCEAVNAMPRAGRRFELRRYDLAETVVELT
jgi:hypothetical protein